MSVDPLVSKLIEANRAYRDGKPIMSDGEYDSLEGQLRVLDPDHPFLHGLSDESPDSYLEETPLTIQMGSQRKALVIEEMDRFLREVNDEIYQWSNKIDGMSCELTFRYGSLYRAVTRGDGKIGVNVTDAVRQIPSVPKRLSITDKIVLIRGEICMFKSSLDKVNAVLEAEGRKPVKNCRNGTVGITKTEKNRHLAKFLDFLAFDLLILQRNTSLGNHLMRAPETGLFY